MQHLKRERDATIQKRMNVWDWMATTVLLSPNEQRVGSDIFNSVETAHVDRHDSVCECLQEEKRSELWVPGKTYAFAEMGGVSSSETFLQ